MKELWKEIYQLIGDPPVIELRETEKIKQLKASLFCKLEEDPSHQSEERKISPADELLKDGTHEDEEDKRMKVLVADIDSFGKLENAVRVFRTHIPDIKIFAAGPDMTNIPDICTGFLQTDPERAHFACKLMYEAEGISIGLKAGATLGAAEELAQKESYAGLNILVFLTDDKEKYTGS